MTSIYHKERESLLFAFARRDRRIFGDGLGFVVIITIIGDESFEIDFNIFNDTLAVVILDRGPGHKKPDIGLIKIDVRVCARRVQRCS